MTESRTAQAQRLMLAFAERTGISGRSPPLRYLWTDAHAVCNFLSLHASQENGQWLSMAVALVDQVHEVLGRHRPDDVRTGWISGLSDSEGRLHPTIGGLRIGKPLPERPIEAPFDERAEWEQDGQYYHYLTKWMHALGRMGAITGDEHYRRWARELAVTAYRGFLASAGPARLYWKMSIDLSYPLVAASGQHDTLDGLVTCLVVRETTPVCAAHELNTVIDMLAALCTERVWATNDPLGLGGLLFDASRISQLRSGIGRKQGLPLLEPILGAAEQGLRSFTRSRALQLPGAQRLAFRELGLGIGLQAIEPMYLRSLSASVVVRLDQLRIFERLRESIERSWLQPDLQQTRNWREHRDINAVMLATSLAPAAFLGI